MPGEVLIAAEGLTLQFKGEPRPAIDHVSAQVTSVGITGLVGPDGAGKTTLLRLFAGLLLADEGQLTVCGLDPRTQTGQLRQVVSYMPQRFGLYEDLSVAENLNLYADLRALVGEEREHAFDRLLAFTGLEPFTDRLAGQLSGGMKQKLGLACALIGSPRLLLLDEPSVGVDPISRRELWKMVGTLVDRGIGVLWSTAYLDEAERCASVLLIHEGKLLHAGPPGELTARVEGRTFVIRDVSQRRQVLARALKHPEVIDGVIQGSRVRLVTRSPTGPPDLYSLGITEGTIEPSSPRFEDGFVDLLGGRRERESQLVEETGRPLGFGMETLVEANDLTRRFGSFLAVDRVSFRISQGEIFGLLGPNGAGKSTTFRMLCGLLPPTSGSARVAGHDLQRAGSAARGRLGYMAQKFSLYGDLSVQQNLTFFAGIYGLAGQHRRDTIRRTCAALGLEPFLQRDADSLPPGHKQRLALACAVMHQPAVLFLDEPTSGVDPLTRREFWSHIHALVEGGVTVLVTTHFMEEAEYCDRIGLMLAGRVIAEGSPDALKERARSEDQPEPTMEDAFVALIEQLNRSP
jgi:ABC-2 type transport system ATP-binding protein